MTAHDLSGIVRGIGPVIRDYVAASLAGFQERLKAIEDRPSRDGLDGRDGKDGKDADVSLVLNLKAEVVACRAELDALRTAHSETVTAMNSTIAAHVTEAIMAMEPPLDGAQGPMGPAGPVGPQGERGEAGPQGGQGEAGEPGTAGDVGPIGPVGERGEAGSIGPSGEPGSAGALGEKGETGLQGIAGRDGLPGVQGPQGDKGFDGKDGAAGLHGKDGVPGRDGTLENLKMVYDGERTVTFCFKNGDPIENGVVRFPFVIDRGVWKSGAVYEQGDGVTWGGSFFIAQVDQPPGQPETKDCGWRLAIKRGRDGKEGARGDKGMDGRPGRDGIDRKYA